MHADAQAWQNDLAEYIIQRSITFLPMEIQLLSIHHWVSLEKTFHLVYYMMKNIEYENLACYTYITYDHKFPKGSE
jgi:hypothetical protein